MGMTFAIRGPNNFDIKPEKKSNKKKSFLKKCSNSESEGIFDFLCSRSLTFLRVVFLKRKIVEELRNFKLKNM